MGGESDKKSEDVKVYTLEQVKEHKTEKDCWIVIHGNVYDVTAYLNEHPGGPEIIQDEAGGVATESFEDTGHSEEARETLKQFLIGKLDPKDAEAAKIAAASNASNSEGPSFLLIVAILVALAAFAYMMMDQEQEKICYAVMFRSCLFPKLIFTGISNQGNVTFR